MSLRKRRSRSRKSPADLQSELSLVNAMIDIQVKLKAYRATGSRSDAEIGRTLRSVLKNRSLSDQVTVVFAPAGESKPTPAELADRPHQAHTDQGNKGTALEPADDGFYQANTLYSCTPLLYWLSRNRLVPLRMITLTVYGNEVKVHATDPHQAVKDSHPGPPPLRIQVPYGDSFRRLLERVNTVHTSEAACREITDFVDAYHAKDEVAQWQKALAHYWTEHKDSALLIGSDPSLEYCPAPTHEEIESACRQFLLLGAYALHNRFVQIDYLLSPGVDGQQVERSSTIVCWTKADRHTRSMRARFSLNLQSILHLPDQSVMRVMRRAQDNLERLRGGLGAAHAIGEWIKRVDFAITEELKRMVGIAGNEAVDNPSSADGPLTDLYAAAIMSASKRMQGLTRRIAELATLTHLGAQRIMSQDGVISAGLASRLGREQAIPLRQFVTDTLTEWFGSDGFLRSNTGARVALHVPESNVNEDVVLRGYLRAPNGTVRYVQDFVYRACLAELIINAVKRSADLSVAERAEDPNAIQPLEGTDLKGALVEVRIVPTAARHLRRGDDHISPQSWSVEVKNWYRVESLEPEVPTDTAMFDGVWSTGGLRFVGALLQEMECGHLHQIIRVNQRTQVATFVSTLVNIGTVIPGSAQ